MILTTRLKMWTLLSHALIVVGLGHGVLTLGILELFGLSALFDNQPNAGNGSDASFLLQSVVLCSLSGQIASIASIFLKPASGGKWLHITGLCMLWASVLLYAYAIQRDNYGHLAVLTCLPFTSCTIWTLLGGHIRLIWQKIEANI